MSEPEYLYVVIDEGCMECGVESELVGASWSEDEAASMMRARDKETKGWRDGGQTDARMFRVEVPTR